MPEKILGGFRNYIGSVATNPRAGTVGVSSPQGNSLVVVKAADGSLMSARALTEVCGIAPDGADFLASTGTGNSIRPEGSTISDLQHVWDNRILRIG